MNSSLAAGFRPEEIAIFYRAIGPLVEAIKDEFTRRNVEFVWERDNKFPSSPFVIWLQRLVAWSLSPPEEREHTFSQLFHDFQLLLQAAGQIDGGEHSLEFRILLWRLTTQTINDKINAGKWLTEAESLIDFQSLLSSSEEYANDLECYEKLKEVLNNGGAQSDARSEFAGIGMVRGKVILTTFHASKGRQFDVVIIPGCAEGILPAWTWNGRNRHFEPPAARPLDETRRLFYVGLSRARHVVYLIHADTWQDKFGSLKQGGCSRFVEEIRIKLDQKAA